jgi:hypothetical protein
MTKKLNLKKPTKANITWAIKEIEVLKWTPTVPHINKVLREQGMSGISAAIRDKHLPKLENIQKPGKTQVKPKKKLVGKKETHGGARKGSGRKLGSAAKKTREIADKLADDGLQTPLEYLLGTMRETPEALRELLKAGEIEEIEFGVRIKSLTSRRDNAASQAAPYIHPRLSSIEAKVEDADHEKWLALLEHSNL